MFSPISDCRSRLRGVGPGHLIRQVRRFSLVSRPVEDTEQDSTKGDFYLSRTTGQQVIPDATYLPERVGRVTHVPEFALRCRRDQPGAGALKDCSCERSNLTGSDMRQLGSCNGPRDRVTIYTDRRQTTEPGCKDRRSTTAKGIENPLPSSGSRQRVRREKKGGTSCSTGTSR